MVDVTIIAYKGGEMIDDGYQWINDSYEKKWDNLLSKSFYVSLYVEPDDETPRCPLEEHMGYIDIFPKTVKPQFR